MSDDHRPLWYRGLERAFDVAVRGAMVLIWVWGLALFALVGWGIYIFLTTPLK